MQQETSMQTSLTRRRPERKVCTGCKVDKPASKFRAARHSRDGLQHFCIPCKVCAGAPLIRHGSCHGPNRILGHRTHLCRGDLGLPPALHSFKCISHRVSWRCPGINCCSSGLTAAPMRFWCQSQHACQKRYKDALREVSNSRGVQRLPEQ